MKKPKWSALRTKEVAITGAWSTRLLDHLYRLEWGIPRTYKQKRKGDRR